MTYFGVNFVSHIYLKKESAGVKSLSLWKGIGLQLIADKSLKYIFLKKKNYMSPFSSPLPSPLVSYFLSLERLSVPSGQSRNMTELSGCDWGKVWRFPPWDETYRGGWYCWQAAGIMLPSGVRRHLKLTETEGGGQLQSSVTWDVTELGVTAAGGIVTQFKSSVSSPACHWAPEVKFTTAEQIMIIKLDKNIIKWW